MGWSPYYRTIFPASGGPSLGPIGALLALQMATQKSKKIHFPVRKKRLGNPCIPRRDPGTWSPDPGGSKILVPYRLRDPRNPKHTVLSTTQITSVFQK